MVLIGRPKEEIITQAPFLCVEVLSDEDRLTRVHQKVQDYFSIGVPHVWIVDPYERAAYVCYPDRLELVRDGYLRTVAPAIELSLDEIFSDLD